MIDISGEKLLGEQAGGCYQGGDLRKLPETQGILFRGLGSGYLGFYFIFICLLFINCPHMWSIDSCTYSAFRYKKTGLKGHILI